MPKLITFLLILFLVSGTFLGCGGGEDSKSAEIDRSNTATLPLGNSQGNAGGDNPSDRRADSSRPGDRENGDSGNSGAGDSETVSTGPRNGLFPSSSSGSGTRFGGGLFPPGFGNNSVASTGDAAPSDPDPFDLGDDFATESGDTAANFQTPPKISLLLDAKKLFGQHNEQAAVNYVYANHLISNESRKKYQLNWYPGLKEPRLFFRWGVGVVFSPKKFEGRHPVIGDPGDPDEGVTGDSNSGRGRGNNGGLGLPGRSGSGRSSSSSRIYKNIDTDRPDGFLMYYTGDFGEKLISFLDERRSDNDEPFYGQILKDVMELKDPEAEAPDSNRGRNTRSGRFSASSASPAGALGGGRGGGTPVERTDTSIIDQATGQSTAEKPENDFSGSIIPGVELLGRGSKSDLIERAKAANVDALIMFNVKISKSRGSRNRRGSSDPTNTNTTSMKILDLKTDGNVYSSKSLKDTDVSEDNSNGDDPVNEQVEEAFETVADKSFKASEMPSAINAKNVKSRIGSLLKSKTGNPLQAAVEIVSFYEAELLPENLAIMAMERLFSDKAAVVLITGTESERLNFLRDKLPEGPGE